MYKVLEHKKHTLQLFKTTIKYMVISIQPNNLRKYLCRKGPFLYFYNEEFKKSYMEIVDYIKKLSILNPKIKVLQIEWSDKIKFESQISFLEIITVYVYFEGEKKHEIFKPKKEDIDFLFIKCIQYYNQKLEKSVNNIGSRGRINPKYKIDPSEPKFLKDFTPNDKRVFQNRARDILKSKIKSPIFPHNLINPSTENSLLKTKNIQYRKIMPKISIDNLINNETTIINSEFSPKLPINEILPNLVKNIIQNSSNNDFKNSQKFKKNLNMESNQTINDGKELNVFRKSLNNNITILHNENLNQKDENVKNIKNFRDETKTVPNKKLLEEKILNLTEYNEFQQMLNSNF